jgi:LEA14-like dessication related protein
MLFPAALLFGCANTKNPSVTLVSASVGQASEHAVTLHMWLHLDNPNDQPLELMEFDYRVEIDGRPVYDGKRAAQMTLAKLSTRDVEIPAVVPFDKVSWPSGIAPSGTHVSVKGTLRYILPGAIAQTLFDTGVRRPRASFHGDQPLTAPR